MPCLDRTFLRDTSSWASGVDRSTTASLFLREWRPSRYFCTRAWESMSTKEMSLTRVVYVSEPELIRAATRGSPTSGFRTVIEKAGRRSAPTVART